MKPFDTHSNIYSPQMESDLVYTNTSALQTNRQAGTTRREGQSALNLVFGNKLNRISCFSENFLSKAFCDFFADAVKAGPGQAGHG